MQHVLGSQVFDYWFDTRKFILVGDGNRDFMCVMLTSLQGALHGWRFSQC